MFKINLKVQTEELVLICHCLRDYSCAYCTDNFMCWRLEKRSWSECANNFAAVSCWRLFTLTWRNICASKRNFPTCSDTLSKLSLSLVKLLPYDHALWDICRLRFFGPILCKTRMQFVFWRMWWVNVCKDVHFKFSLS